MNITRDSLNTVARWAVVSLFVLIVEILIILSAANYPVQWRRQVDVERRQYLEVIDQAILYRTLDYGSVPDLPDRPSIVSNTGTCEFFCPKLNTALPCFDLQSLLIPNYIRALPQDPFVFSNHDSGFYIQAENGLLELGSCRTYFGSTVRVLRNLNLADESAPRADLP